MKMIFAGTPEFAAVALKALIDAKHQIIAVYTQPDRPAGRGQKLHQSPVKALALKNNLPLFQPKSLRDEKAQNEFKALGADLMIVAAYGLILPKVILETPRLGCINIHGSLLPRWRGAAPIQRAILAGDQRTGITIMKMDEGLDTGDMLYKLNCPIEKTDTAQSLHDRLALLGAKALLEALPAISNQTLHPEKQNEMEATYASKITKTEAQIDWKKTSCEIERQIRAYHPFPIAYTFIDHQLIKIWEAHGPENNSQSTQAPGTILKSDRDGITIATGDSTISITKMQLAGGKVLNIRDILNSRNNLFLPGNKLCQLDFSQS